MSVQFATPTAAEVPHLAKVTSRAVDLLTSGGVSTDEIEVQMDLLAVHHHTPLDFARMADADRANFAHDVCGIYRHLDRRTGLLRDCFVPRYARW